MMTGLRYSISRWTSRKGTRIACHDKRAYIAIPDYRRSTLSYLVGSVQPLSLSRPILAVVEEQRNIQSHGNIIMTLVRKGAIVALLKDNDWKSRLATTITRRYTSSS